MVFWAPEAGQATFLRRRLFNLHLDSFFEDISNLNRNFEILTITLSIPNGLLGTGSR